MCAEGSACSGVHARVSRPVHITARSGLVSPFVHSAAGGGRRAYAFVARHLAGASQRAGAFSFCFCPRVTPHARHRCLLCRLRSAPRHACPASRHLPALLDAHPTAAPPPLPAPCGTAPGEWSLAGGRSRLDSSGDTTRHEDGEGLMVPVSTPDHARSCPVALRPQHAGIQSRPCREMSPTHLTGQQRRS